MKILLLYCGIGSPMQHVKYKKLLRHMSLLLGNVYFYFMNISHGTVWKTMFRYLAMTGQIMLETFQFF